MSSKAKPKMFYVFRNKEAPDENSADSEYVLLMNDSLLEISQVRAERSGFAEACREALGDKELLDERFLAVRAALTR